MDQARVQTMEAVEDLRHEDVVLTSDWAGWMLEGTDATGTVLFTIDLDADGPGTSGERVEPGT